MLLEDINSIIEEHNTLGAIEPNKWDGLTNNQRILLNACPIELTYSMVVALLSSHNDPFNVEQPKVETTSYTQSNPVINQFPDSHMSLDDKLDKIIDLITKLITTLQVDQLRAEQ